MAQWLGMGSGLTHLSKVEESQGLLRHAVDVFRSVGEGGKRGSQAKAVVRLAKRLLAGRRILIKAKIAAAEDVQSGAALALRSDEIAGLKRQEAKILSGGLEAILAEFVASDALVRDQSS